MTGPGYSGASGQAHILRMPQYTVMPRVRQDGFKIEYVGDDGARHTLLGFNSKEEAEAWVETDRKRTTLPQAAAGD